MFPSSLINFPTLWHGNKPDRCCMLRFLCAVNEVYCCSTCCHACWMGQSPALQSAGLSHVVLTTYILYHIAHFTFFSFYLWLGFCLTFEYWEMRSWKKAVRWAGIEWAFLSAQQPLATGINSTAETIFSYKAEIKDQSRLLYRSIGSQASH